MKVENLSKINCASIAFKLIPVDSVFEGTWGATDGIWWKLNGGRYVVRLETATLYGVYENETILNYRRVEKAKIVVEG